MGKVAAVVLLFGWVGQAQATMLMPDFGSTVPGGWVTDRFEPNSFANIGTFNGRDNVLEIGISSAQGAANRPAGQQGTFYSTQGRQYGVTGGAGDSFGASLWLDSLWRDEANGSVRTDMWGALQRDPPPATGDTRDYPIIGFTNIGNDPRLRVWDGNTGTGWIDLGVSLVFDAWVDLNVVFTGSAYEYYVNGVLEYTDATTNDASTFDVLIMQAFNFDDPALTGFVTSDYEARWANLSVLPEPGTLGLVLAGLFGVAAFGVRRRHKSRASG